MDDRIQEKFHKRFHGFMQNVALGMQSIPKAFEEDKKYLFVFMDHLGFSKKVLRAVENDEWLSFCASIDMLLDESLRNILKNCQMWSSPISMVKEKRFSDSICLYWEIGDYEETSNRYSSSELTELLREVLFLVANIQMNASIHETLFRGGIAIGHYFEYNSITISDALVRAHAIENSINIPVVGIDESVWQELNDEGAHQRFISEGYLTKHYEKQQEFEYVDFINTVLRNEKITELGMKKQYFMNMKTAILSNWNDAKITAVDNKIKTRLKEKYTWLFEYYNQKCEQKNMMKYAIDEKIYDELKGIATY